MEETKGLVVPSLVAATVLPVFTLDQLDGLVLPRGAQIRRVRVPLRSELF